jgi:phosphoribosylaminoimidazolecarboxamide formyltransferase/IMP cyclohydrolase
LNAWQLVKELKKATNKPSAASFKHVNPAGAAVGRPLNGTLRKAYLAEGLDNSELACAYLRARGTDRISSYGDFIAVSDKLDIHTAKIITKEVSDGIIAPDYDTDALELLKTKRKGNYLVLSIDKDYEPGDIEEREVFGIKLRQKRNDCIITDQILKNAVTRNKNLPDDIIEDIFVSLITLKYTQSNSICIALDGQTIGVGAGQQSRIHCTKLALSKSMTWYLRQHPGVLGADIPGNLSRTGTDILINNFIEKSFTENEKKENIRKCRNLVLSSDGMFPQRDNIDLADEYGIKYIVQPGNSIRDREVIDACDEHGMVMLFTGLRLFHH